PERVAGLHGVVSGSPRALRRPGHKGPGNQHECRKHENFPEHVFAILERTRVRVKGLRDSSEPEDEANCEGGCNRAEKQEKEPKGGHEVCASRSSVSLRNRIGFRGASQQAASESKLRQEALRHACPQAARRNPELLEA